ncbi:MAG TPA: hypothetical protein VMD76_12525 [Candidatus Sulfotelmatobacter sp.]|nr:hypothetical protein [Candidatus Sulfotelmatobacter sp.]
MDANVPRTSKLMVLSKASTTWWICVAVVVLAIVLLLIVFAQSELPHALH